MKRKLKETKECFEHRLFISRTRQVVANHRAKAKEKGQRCKYTLQEIREELIPFMASGCWYCNEKITVKNFSLDHAIPISRLGKFTLDNLRIICLKCNQTKGALTDVEFSELLELAKKWPPEAQQDIRRRLRAGSKALGRMFGKHSKPRS